MQDVNADVLEQIFLACLPDDPMEHVQPDVTLAPMLLCQVCSHWRFLALGMPRLWESLYNISFISSRRVPASDVLRKGIRESDLEFLKWWKSNLASRSPSLRLRLSWNKLEKRGRPQRDETAFIISFLTCARYLDIDSAYTLILYGWRKKAPLPFHYLDTLLIRHNFSAIDKLSAIMENRIQLIPIEAASLRRFYAEHVCSPCTECVSPSFRWETLTHVRLDVMMPIKSWWYFIRRFSSLQIGYFYINLKPVADEDLADYEAVERTLYDLRQLHISLEAEMGFADGIFHNLSLPGLTSLRLSPQTGISIDELHGILSSTPSLKELHLCGRIPLNWRTLAVHIPDAEDNHDPLSKYVPHLERLLFDGSSLTSVALCSWFKSLLTTGWLQLGQGTNSINRVEASIVQLHESGLGPWNSTTVHNQPTPTMFLHPYPLIAVFHRRNEAHIAKMREILSTFTEKLDGVEVVIRDPDAPKLYNGWRLSEEGRIGNLDDLGFHDWSG